MILRTFECMEVAEQEISRAKLDRAQDRQAFKILCPTEPLRGKSPELYRAHARELLGRLKKGQKIALATDAELLALFSDTSQKAPLHGTASAAMEILFRRCLPDEHSKLAFEGGAGREIYPGAALEEIEKARRKFSSDRSLE